MTSLDEWQSYSGMLDVKSGLMHTWKSRFVVLSNNLLSIFKDSSRSKLLDSFSITDYTRVEALPGEGLRLNIFAVISDLACHDKLVLSAATGELMEIWMLSLIQSSRGSFLTSERFSVGSNPNLTFQRRVAGEAAVPENAPPIPNASYYLNDETLMGRLRRSDLRNPSVRNNFNAFYREYFCFMCSPPIPAGFILVRVCENQRYLPLKKWNCLHLLPGDPAKLSDSSGRKYPFRYLKTANPPAGYQWCSEESLSRTNLEDIKPGWSFDTVIGGEGGWRYAPSFTALNSTGSSYIDLASFSPKSGDFVRRREWMRYAELTGDEYQNSPLPDDDEDAPVVATVESRPAELASAAYAFVASSDNEERDAVIVDEVIEDHRDEMDI